MAYLILILGEQLNLELPVLKEAVKTDDEIILIESARKAGLNALNRHKLVYQWSIMREFADELRNAGYKVNYVSADKSQHFKTRDIVAVRYHKGGFEKVATTTPISRVTQAYVTALSKVVPLEIKPGNQFLIPDVELIQYPGLDFAEFQKQFKSELSFTPRFQLASYYKQLALPVAAEKFASMHAKAVTAIVEKSYPLYSGNLKKGLSLPTSKPQLREMLANPAIAIAQKTTAIEAALDTGFMLPQEVIAKADKDTDILLLQMLVAREYYHYIYANKPRSPVKLTKPLPKGAVSAAPFDSMNCAAVTAQQIAQGGFSGELNYIGVVQNLLILMSTDHDAIVQWFTINTTTPSWLAQARLDQALATLSLNAGNYINQNTAYCKDCRYRPQTTVGSNACPFNYLFWQFLIQYQDSLSTQPHLRTHYQRLREFSTEQKADIAAQAQTFITTARKQLTYRQVPAAREH